MKRNPFVERRAVGLAIVAALLCGGCEVLEPTGVITLQPATVEVSFRFSNVLQGLSRQTTAEETINLDAFLLDNQFTRSDVVAARVTRLRVRLTTPFQETLAAFSDIQIVLQATSGLGPDLVGTLDAPPDAREATLSVAGATITPYVQGGPFQAVLRTVGALDVDEDFLLFATLTIEVDVEGGF
jgi:hypothetical protein